MKITYTCEDNNCQYLSNAVERFLIGTTPGATSSNSEDTVDRVTELLMGTRNIRLAGCPNPESQVLIRQVVRGAIAEKRPIPILVASGPKKNKGGDIDLAEFSVIQTLVRLQKQVRDYHETGLSIRIRMEDATGRFMEGFEANADMEQYIGQFKTLCDILGHHSGEPQFLFPRGEAPGKLVDFLSLASTYSQVFLEAYASGGVEEEKLAKIGWRGGLTQEWKSYLEKRYQLLYPNMSLAERNVVASRYLAATLARVNLDLVGGSPEWQIDGKHIYISFAPPGPGAPLISTRIHYRTMNAKQTRLHVPFWRGKGFFRMVDGSMSMGLVPSTHVGNTYAPGEVELSYLKYNLRIQADMLIDSV